LNKLDALINELKESSEIKRFRDLEHIIMNDTELLEKFNIMLDKQKVMVNDKELGRKNYEFSKNDYNETKTLLLSNIIVEEYLTLINDINDDLQLLKNIISNEVNKEFEDWYLWILFLCVLVGNGSILQFPIDLALLILYNTVKGIS